MSVGDCNPAPLLCTWTGTGSGTQEVTLTRAQSSQRSAVTTSAALRARLRDWALVRATQEGRALSKKPDKKWWNFLWNFHRHFE